MALALLVGAVIWLLRRSATGKPPNPIQEAEVYLAYGRRQQAIKVLQAALMDDPGNAELAKKLAETQALT